MQVESQFQFLHEKKIGALLDGRTFDDFFKCFVLVGYDKCCIASEGHIHIVGNKEKRKVPLIIPFFTCSYRLPYNFLLVLNPICYFL